MAQSTAKTYDMAKQERDIYTMTTQELKASVAVHRGHSTRAWADLRRVMDVLKAEEVQPAVLQNMQELWTNIQYQRGRITEMYQQIKNLDATQAGWVETRLREFNTNEDPKIDGYFLYLSKVPAETTAPVAAPVPPRPDQGAGRKEPPKTEYHVEA